MSWLLEFLSSRGATLLYSLIIGVSGWVLAHFVAQPIIDLRQKRVEALTIGERYTFVDYRADQDIVRTARSKLFDISSSLRALAREGSWTIRLYCRFYGYDLETAAGTLAGLGQMAGEHLDEERRRNNRDAMYWSLGAHKHLSADRIAALELTPLNRTRDELGKDVLAG
jgi:hypothetical protein